MQFLGRYLKCIPLLEELILSKAYIYLSGHHIGSNSIGDTGLQVLAKNIKFIARLKVLHLGKLSKYFV